MSLRSFASWKSLLIVGGVALCATVGIFNFGQTTYAAGYAGICSTNSDCNEGWCAEGGCICTAVSLCDFGLDAAGVAAAARAGRDATEGVPVVEDVTAAVADAAESALSTSDACGTANGPFVGFVCQGMIFVLSVIVELLGKLVTLLLSILLAFAKYNSFTSAAPVRAGWPIVRDVCNMFFIIILLVSAFATIIDQAGSDLHYTKVLPKLLVMAVLINFSKTLIQLLIDFSQVVMLTFVNAFAAAASGNFVEALGLIKIMQMSEGVHAGTATNVNLIVSYMLAIFMLAITLSVVGILTGFLIFRIVGLWIALILSPLAFFATAVPGRLAKGLGSIAGEYWSRLGNLLSGGPIIAFFLWLTLAVVQQANSGAAGAELSQVLDFEVEGDLQVFLTSVGNAQSIASFIVGITLLLMGLDQAVKSANSIGSTLLSTFAQRAKGAGMSLGRLGALAPFLAAGYGVRAGARAGYRAVDQRLDLTRKVSTAGLQATNALANAPVVGALGGRALRTAARPTLAKGLTMRREEAAKEASEEARLVEKVGKVGTDAELKLVGSTYSMSDSAFRTLGARAGSMKVAEILASDDLRDREAKRTKGAFIEQIKASNPGISDDEAKAGSDVMSKEAANREQAKFVQAQLALAKKANDTDKVEKLEKYIKANPHLASTQDRDKYIGDLATDPDLYKDVGKLDAMSGEVATGFMLKHGWKEVEKERKDENGNVIGTYKTLEQTDKAAWDRVKDKVQKSGNKDLLTGLRSHEDLVTQSPTTDYRDLKQVQHRFNAADGQIQAFKVDPSALPGTGGVRIRNEAEREAISSLKKAAEQPAGYQLPVADAQKALRSGATIKEVLDVSKNAQDPVQAVADGVVFQNMLTAAEFAGDNEQAFNDAVKNFNSVIKQIDAQGVTSDHQVKIVHAALMGGLKDLVSKGKYEKVARDQRGALVKLISVAKERVNDLKQADLTAMKEADRKMAQEIIDKMAELEREAAKNKDSAIPGGAVKQILRKDVSVE